MPTLHFCISTATFLDNKWRPAFFIAKRFGVHCCTWQLLIFTFCPVRCWQRFDLQMETHYCFDWLIDCMLIPIMKMRKSQLPRTFSICFNRNEPTSYPGSYLRWPPRPTSSMLARSRAWNVCGVWGGVRGAGCGVWLWCGGVAVGGDTALGTRLGTNNGLKSRLDVKDNRKCITISLSTSIGNHCGHWSKFGKCL